MKFVPDHKHFIASVTFYETIITETRVKIWLEELAEVIGMEILHPAVVVSCYDEGNEGITGFLLLSTSHISIHIWDQAKKPYAQIDVYSCKEFDLNLILDEINKLDADDVTYLAIDRNIK
jgi:S-adenosylmethionine/arginine decarboxylase-like enzyme